MLHKLKLKMKRLNNTDRMSNNNEKFTIISCNKCVRIHNRMLISHYWNVSKKVKWLRIPNRIIKSQHLKPIKRILQHNKISPPHN